MRKKIAVLTNDGKLCNDFRKNTDVNIFVIDEDKIVEYEHLKLKKKNADSLGEIIKSKKISLVYVSHISEEIKEIIKKVGCLFKQKDDFAVDEVVGQFAFS